MDLGKSFLSIANLSLRFWAHWIGKPFVDPERRGKALFETNYRDDRLAPYTPVQFARLPRYETCVNCGLCDAACVEAKAARRRIGGDRAGPEFVQPSLIAISVSRAQPLFHTGADLAAFYVSCGECRRCEEVCPNQVPILEIARMVTEGARQPHAGR